MDEGTWQKIANETRKNTQRIANNIYMIRQEQIIAELEKLMGVKIEIEPTVKKGRPKTVPKNYQMTDPSDSL